MRYEEKIESASLILKNQDLKSVYLKFRSHLERLDGTSLIIPHRSKDNVHTGLYNGAIFNIEMLAKSCMDLDDDLRIPFKYAVDETEALIPFANVTRNRNNLKALIEEIHDQDDDLGDIYFFLDESEHIWSIWDQTVYKIAFSIDQFLLEIVSGLADGYPESYDVFYRS